MALHITAGEFRGRKIESIPGTSARPTSSSVRNAVFNILGDSVAGTRVIDFFCAGGTLGIEALSHGAASCCFVENGRKALHVLRQNIEKLGIEDRCQVLSMNALTCFETLEQRGTKFDLLFADPPYQKQLALPLINQLEKSSILAENAFLILEASSRETFEFPPTINILKSRISGDTAVHFISFDKP